MSRYDRSIVDGWVSVLVAITVCYCPATFPAGQPTAVSNLPVVTADRHKSKQRKGSDDSKRPAAKGGDEGAHRKGSEVIPGGKQ